MKQGAKINKFVPHETKPILNGMVEDPWNGLWNGAKRKREDDSSVTAKRHHRTLVKNDSRWGHHISVPLKLTTRHMVANSELC